MLPTSLTAPGRGRTRVPGGLRGPGDVKHCIHRPLDLVRLQPRCDAGRTARELPDRTSPALRGRGRTRVPGDSCRGRTGAHTSQTCSAYYVAAAALVSPNVSGAQTPTGDCVVGHGFSDCNVGRSRYAPDRDHPNGSSGPPGRISGDTGVVQLRALRGDRRVGAHLQGPVPARRVAREKYGLGRYRVRALRRCVNQASRRRIGA
jgi:hypothetical protein